jgi:hypothetical protein
MLAAALWGPRGVVAGYPNAKFCGVTARQIGQTPTCTNIESEPNLDAETDLEVRPAD